MAGSRRESCLLLGLCIVHPCKDHPKVQMSHNMLSEPTGYMCHALYNCFDDTDSNNLTWYMCYSLDGSLVQCCCQSVHAGSVMPRMHAFFPHVDAKSASNKDSHAHSASAPYSPMEIG